MSIYLLPGIGFGIRTSDQRKMFKCHGSVAQLRDTAAIVSQLISEKRIISQNSDILPLAEKLYLEWKLLNQSGTKNKGLSNISHICPKIYPSTLASLNESIEGQRSSSFPNIDRVKQKIIDYGYKIKKHSFEKKTNNISNNQITDTLVVCTDNGEVIAEGKGLTDESKLNSLIGETVERICAMSSDFTRIVPGLAPADMLDRGYIIPKYESTGRDLYKENLCIDWVQGELYPAEPAWLPAEKVWNQHVPLSGVFSFDLRTTVGLASGATFADGFANGLLEVLEKDAYSLVMRCRISCPDIEKVDLLNCGDQVLNILKSLEALGIEAHFKWISLDWPIPIAHVLLVDKNERIPAHSHGCSAALSTKVAITRALLEAIQVFSGLAAMASQEWLSIATRGECGYMRPQHAWSDPLFRPALKHLMNNSQLDSRINNLNLRNTDWRIFSIKELCDWLVDNKYKIFSAFVGSIDEIKVMRVYIEGLTIPDSYIENSSDRLDFWLERLKLPSPYTDPILS